MIPTYTDASCRGCPSEALSSFSFLWVSLHTSGLLSVNFKVILNWLITELHNKKNYMYLDEGPRLSLCTQVPCLAVKKLNRSIITESYIFCKCIIPIIRKEYTFLLLTTTLMKNGKKRSYFCE